MGVVLFVMRVRVAFAVPFGPNTTLPRLKAIMGRSGTTGERQVRHEDRLIAPEKPVRLVRTIVDVVESPWWVMSDAGVAVLLKSSAVVLTNI